MNAKTIKPIAALALTAAGSALVVGFRTPEAALSGATTASGATSAATTTASNPTTTSASTSTTTSSTAAPTASASTSVAGSTSTGTGTVASATTYTDGTYTGSAVSEPWGTFQVRVVISGGKITGVTVVAAPTDRKSSSINATAVPRLTASAIAKQSAAVDMVSGATWTSRSYATSLQAALDQAAAKKAA